MKFARNVTVFSTLLHREIYMKALRLVPPEVSLAELEKTDPIMAASGREFYNFMLELYSDMYCNPDAYGMTPGAYEDFAAGRHYSFIRLRVKNTGNFYDLSGAQISSYENFIREIALYCNISDGCCYLTYDDFDKVKDLKRITAVKGQHLLLPIETVMKNLERVGLYFCDNGKRIQVISEIYPNMFLSASALKHAVEDTINNPVSKKLKYFFGEYIDTLEFRLLQGIYYPNFEDQIRSLSDKDREAVIALDALTKEYKLRPNYKASQNGFEYKYKGQYVMGVWTNGCFAEPNSKHSSWIRYVRCRIAGPVNSSYLENVEKFGDDFKKYFMRHLNLCSGCTPWHLADTSAVRYIFGRKVRFCSDDIAAVFAGFTMDDLPYIKRFIELRIDQIKRNN